MILYHYDGIPRQDLDKNPEYFFDFFMNDCSGRFRIGWCTFRSIPVYIGPLRCFLLSCKKFGYHNQ
ncbi:hypothetical protein DF182_27985 [Chitinophaga flava]|uniref:Uncharacterized protein n=1 Tax=Chitinophaga flava TaxID=2259036 RepID=A0A365XW47_9BACT|nr:hypothetical protein DF182_27985 [Chitinophaga flava]